MWVKRVIVVDPVTSWGKGRRYGGDMPNKVLRVTAIHNCEVKTASVAC